MRPLKLTEAVEREIRHRYSGGCSTYSLAAQFHLSRTTIRRILRAGAAPAPTAAPVSAPGPRAKP